MTYSYVAWKDEGMWTVHTPSVPGLYGVGKTRRAAERDFRQALSLLLAYLDEIGEAPPKPTPVYTGKLAV
jgi:predicted RNase H-like HicB family nuclease